MLSLREWIRKIEKQIEELYKDKQLYEQIIKELQDGTNTEEDLSSFRTIEFIQEPRQLQRQTIINESDLKPAPATNKTKSKKQKKDKKDLRELERGIWIEQENRKNKKK